MTNSKKVQNPEKQIAKTSQMNDRDFTNDLLAMEKYMSDSYSIYLNEASNQTLYGDFMRIFTETKNEQRHLYNLMFERGWYSLDAADQQSLQQSYQQFQGYSTQFPYGTNGNIQ
ncbi:MULTISPECIES: spore coat protein [Cytobacillus]|uniref:Spore coat protein n=1 Tax=Cytobacillus stercorigallinarum TaxID=2762240 RepID=A0ABR8QV93_9BACI|nr:spore coat protein [Cytobacillus stercorigallinarum]MBD7939418.1 spore coat protein [Cytobacillus stercorigallinarum]